MIAMAICSGPRLLIADEPTTALDAIVQKTIIELLGSIQKARGMAVLFITHDLPLVASLAPRILIMRQGILVEEGTTNRIFPSPSHPYTRGLLACRPRLDFKGKRLPTLGDFLETGQVLPAIALFSKGIQVRESGKQILEVHHIRVSLPGRKQGLAGKASRKEILSDISLSLKEGETLGLLGGSGSGKTTLGKAIAGLIPLDQGRILFQGIRFGNGTNGTGISNSFSRIPILPWILERRSGLRSWNPW